MRVDVQIHFLPEQYLEVLTDMDRAVTVKRRKDHLYIKHEHDSFPL